ncbi:hypothetical protein OIU79_026284 [Salix purpurea]|uniref:Uncharacterized protein n=1 Tax=Salix purpurea TaxID=77065 RepID=A0A9Q1A085_SALPP|nr:hypothetical protein OIU79_026284 [Salix purpurea]
MACVLGLSFAIGWEQASPSSSSLCASSAAYSWSSLWSTASSKRPSRWRDQTQSTRNWNPPILVHGRWPHTTSRTTAPKP